MPILDRKLFRDFARIWAQALAVALVMACGVMTIILAVGAYRSLEETRNTFYERYRFGNIFASANRAPASLVRLSITVPGLVTPGTRTDDFAATGKAPHAIARQVAAIPGVSAVDVRIKKPVIIDVKGMREPASGVAISIPDRGIQTVNRLYLRQGRFPEAGRRNEVAIVETFAEAHGLSPGDTFHAILNGRKLELDITGIVLSPEYIYAIGPGDIMPDQRRFGVFYMAQSKLEGIFGMAGAFNAVALTTLPGADHDAIIDEIDTLLKTYGGTGAYERKDQQSNAFLDSELKQLNAMSRVIPPIFLAVAAFLVNMILSRLIALEREQIGLLKALGYSNFAVASHYAKLVTLIAIIGLIIGSGAGFWLGRGLTRLYAEFFSFPFLIFRQSIDLYVLAGVITIASALAGAAKAIWGVVTLPPAVAMRPPAPPQYRRLLSSGRRRIQLFSQLTNMAFRHMIRWPVRTAMTTLGTSMSVALLVTSLFSYDSINYMIDVVFFQTDRHDASVTFGASQGAEAMSDVAALPGVMRAEPYRVVPIILRNGHASVRMAVTALPPDTTLSRILDADTNPLDPPEAGIMISERVAKKLRVRTGDQLEVELTQHLNRIEMVTVTSIVKSFIGLAAYMDIESLNRLVREGPRISGARIMIDDNRINDLYRTVKKTPALSTIALQKITLKNFRDIIEENITTMTAIYVVLAAIITFGVVYNSARIQLSERARELASLRVFGFTRGEVSSILLTELFVIVLLAQPLGWIIGYVFSKSVVTGFESDLFSIPFVITPATYAWSSIVVLTAAVASALLVRRRVDHLDLIRVLKTRE